MSRTRARGRQARLFGEALRPLRRGGQAAEGARRRARTSASARAPDTFLGGAHQYARKLIDEGAIGTVTAGTAYVMSHGMEMWHPNPGFFFQPGAGPVLDVGPYYVADLINLLGPVKPRRRRHQHGDADPPRHRRRPAQGQGDPGRHADERPRAARIRTAAPASCSARAGTSGRTATATSSSTAPRARSSCPTRTCSAAPSRSPAATARSSRRPSGTIPSASPTTTVRRRASPTTARPVSPTWRSPSSRDGRRAARSTLRCMPST